MTPRNWTQHNDHSQPLANLVGGFTGHAVEIYGERLFEGLRFDDACLEYSKARKAGHDALGMLAATLAKRVA